MFFQNNKRDRKIFQCVIIINTIILISLVFYADSVIFLSCINGFDVISNLGNADKEDKMQLDDSSVNKVNWMSLFAWSLCLSVIIVLIGIQITVDVNMLNTPDENEHIRIDDVASWIIMSTWFLILSTLIFTFSIFFNPRRHYSSSPTSDDILDYDTPPKLNPVTIFILGFGGLILRFVQLYMGHRYLAWVKAGACHGNRRIMDNGGLV